MRGDKVGASPKPNKGPEPLLPCIHRGQRTGEAGKCGGCTGNANFFLFKCDLHGKCVVTDKQVAGAVSCKTCKDRKPVFRVKSESRGIGDQLLSVMIAAGVQEKSPDAEVLYECAGEIAGNVRPWVELFWPVSGNAKAQEVFCDHTGDHAAFSIAGLARWEWWAQKFSAKPVVPAFRGAFDEWAVPYAGRIVLSPFAAHANRTWPVANWIEVERQLLSLKFGCVVIDDKPNRTDGFQSDKVISESPRRVASLLKYAGCVAGNDSGMAHIAGMLGAPTVAVCSRMSDCNIFGCYPTVQSIGGRNIADLKDTKPDQVVQAILAQTRTDGFPAERFASILAERDRDDLHRWLPVYGTLWQTVKRINPKRIVEIGVRAGYSAWTMLDACPKAEVIGIDADLAEHGGYKGACEHAKRILFDKPFELEIADSHTLTSLPACDMAYIDGDHLEEGCYADLLLAEQTPIILVDDYTNLESVRVAVRRFMAERPHLRGEFIPSATGLYLIRREPC